MNSNDGDSDDDRRAGLGWAELAGLMRIDANGARPRLVSRWINGLGRDPGKW
jgi:hypothetical protein